MTNTRAPAATDSRQSLRQQIRIRRRSLTAQQQQQAAQAAASHMLQYAPLLAAQHIALYMSFDGELDTRPLIDALWAAGKKLYLPRLHPFCAGHLLFLRYRPQTVLSQDKFTIYQPPLDVRQILPVNKLDILITPLVAFDEHGQRLGMGGGFYDRTLQRWRSHKLLPVGYAHDCQLVPPLAAEHWDIPLPVIITPSRIWQWQ